MVTLQDEFNELQEIKRIIEGQTFQRLFVKPLKDYRFKQKNNFFSDSMKDQWRKGGRVEGINEFFKILKQIDNDFKNKYHDLESQKG
jgi:hypothetical protein